MLQLLGMSQRSIKFELGIHGISSAVIRQLGQAISVCVGLYGNHRASDSMLIFTTGNTMQSTIES